MTKSHVSRGLAWVGTASSLVGLLDILALVILLNVWIDPDELGLAASVLWLFPILDQATDLGLSAAVVQRDDHDHDVISTVFWINLTSATVLFLAILVAAPLLYTGAAATAGWMLVAYGSKLLWQNVYFIPGALMKKELRFKELSIIRVLANVAEFAGKIGFAAAGFGIWAFVLGPLCRVLVSGIGCQICHPWRPRFVLRLRRAWSYASFGARSAGSQILFYFYTNIDYPIVEHFFGYTALGLYRTAYDVVLEPVRVISDVTAGVAFPTFTRLRNSRAKLIAQFISFVRLNLVGVMLFAVVIFVVADDFLAVAFPKYAGAGDAIRILCAVAVLRSVSFVVPPLLDGMGHPSRTLVYTTTAAVVLPLSYVGAAHFLGGDLGYLAVAWAWAAGYPVAFLVLMMIALYTLEMPVLRFVRAVIGVPLCLLAGGVVGALVQWACGGLGVWLRLGLPAAAIVAVAGVLLAYTQGLSISQARRAMRGGGEASPPGGAGPAAADEAGRARGE